MLNVCPETLVRVNKTLTTGGIIEKFILKIAALQRQQHAAREHPA